MQTKMEKAMNKAQAGFTLVELIVVIAIVAILSTVGFVSYNGYIKDARNTTRVQNVASAVGVIQQFVANKGRPPACKAGDAVKSCEFSNGANGIADTDWAALNTTKAPTDPRKKVVGGVETEIYYVYGYDGSDFEVAATKEDGDTYTAIVQGSKSQGDIIPGVDAPNTPVASTKKCANSAPSKSDGAKQAARDGYNCVPYTL